MLLQAAVGLAICSLMIEGFLAMKWHAWRRFVSSHAIAGLPVSLLLSWLLGEAFGMHGVTVGIAAVMSTAGGIGMYMAMEYWYTNEDECKQMYAEARQTVIDFARVLWWCIRVITWPLRLARSAVRFAQTNQARASALKERAATAVNSVRRTS